MQNWDIALVLDSCLKINQKLRAAANLKIYMEKKNLHQCAMKDERST